MKRFNVAGVCVPEKHYMVNLTERVDAVVNNYIRQGAYLTVNRARQFGKTTILNALERRLRGEYVAISISLEAADD